MSQSDSFEAESNNGMHSFVWEKLCMRVCLSIVWILSKHENVQHWKKKKRVLFSIRSFIHSVYRYCFLCSLFDIFDVWTFNFFHFAFEFHFEYHDFFSKTISILLEKWLEKQLDRNNNSHPNTYTDKHTDRWTYIKNKVIFILRKREQNITV